MGALTLKSFPFELRGWDIEKFESIDPTDGFGSNTRVYISKDQIVQIEPDYNVYTFNSWLTDKGRQFFDGIFGIWSHTKNKLSLKKNHWNILMQTLVQTLYIFDQCNSQKSKKYFFTIIFENLSLENLSLLLLISQNYSFIKLRRLENFKLNNDLETNLQLSSVSNKFNINQSNLCLLISTNPRYEGSYLNLNLRQRYFKGNFKCLVLGSFIDLTFPTFFIGSNLNILKSIIKGNHLLCQDIKLAQKPTLIYNYELLKRYDRMCNVKMLSELQRLNIFNRWNGINLTSPSLAEVGLQSLNKFLPVSYKDLTNFSSLYFLNISLNNISKFKKITETKLLNYSKDKSLNTNKLFIDQNSNFNNNFSVYNTTFLKKESEYTYLPSSMFYENEETFINTEGFIKRTNKLIFRKRTKNSWQILRKILKQFKTHIRIITNIDNQTIGYNSKKINDFKHFISFHYTASQSLTHLNFYLNIKTKQFNMDLTKSRFKTTTMKILSTKVKYWLDDFFSGSKDEYSQNSLVLSNCSKILRTESTNFF